MIQTDKKVIIYDDFTGKTISDVWNAIIDIIKSSGFGKIEIDITNSKVAPVKWIVIKKATVSSN